MISQDNLDQLTEWVMAGATQDERTARAEQGRQLVLDAAREGASLAAKLSEAGAAATSQQQPKKAEVQHTAQALLVSHFMQQGKSRDEAIEAALNADLGSFTNEIAAERQRVTGIEQERLNREFAESPEGKLQRIQQERAAAEAKTKLAADARWDLEHGDQFTPAMLDQLTEDELIQAAGLSPALEQDTYEANAKRIREIESRRTEG
jgi:hypothetical protein